MQINFWTVLKFRKKGKWKKRSYEVGSEVLIDIQLINIRERQFGILNTKNANV